MTMSLQYDDDPESALELTPPTPGTPARPSPGEREASTIGAQLEASFDPAFCRKTTVPVPDELQKYCTLAGELPNCKGLASACTTTLAPKASLPTPSWVGTVAKAGIVVFLVLIVVALVLVIVRSLRRVQRDEVLAETNVTTSASLPDGLSPTHALLPALDDPEAILHLADARAHAGEFSLALGLYLSAALKSLDHRGAIALSKDRTNGEYVRECKEEAAHRDLSLLVREVDKVHFGGSAPTRDQLSVARGYAASLLRVAMLALASLAFAAGCTDSSSGSSAPRNSLTDPLGHELARAALGHKGFTVESWNKPLDRLGKPAPDDPWIIVDVERFELGDESRKHVVAWVEAGGRIALFGGVADWPKEFGCTPGRIPPDRKLEFVTAAAVAKRGDPFTVARLTNGKAAGAHPSLVASLSGVTLGRYSDGSPYALSLRLGKGHLIAVASEESLTNIGLQDPGVLTAFVSIADHFDGNRIAFLKKRAAESAGNGPVGAMMKAGFGSALLHALIASLLLFVAVGYRLTSPPAAPRDRRRAFVEHIRAVAGLYQRTRSTRHALSAFRRFAEERLRQRMPHWEQDVASYISSRSGEPRDYCASVWEYARAADASQPRQATDLEYLRALIRLYRSATTSGKVHPLAKSPSAVAETEPLRRGSTAIRLSSRIQTDKKV